MYSFRYGGKTGKRQSLTTSDEHVVVRTNNRSALLVERTFEATQVSRGPLAPQQLRSSGRLS